MLKVLEKDDRYVLYNTLTDGLATVRKGSKSLDELMGDANFKKFLDDNFVVLLDESFDQRKAAKYVVNKSKYGRDKLFITDASSYRCNLRCVYCVQQNTFKNVEEIAIKERVDIWQSLLESSGLQVAKVILFGGEPFLDCKRVDSLLAEAESRKFPVSSYNAVTNGVNLKRDAVDIINKYPFENLQVTLDGTRTVHDKRRYKVDGSGSFDEIVSNMALVLSETPVTIVVNTVLDKNNVADHKQLVMFLKAEFTKYVDEGRIIFNTGMECHPLNKCTYTSESIPESEEYAGLFFDAVDFLLKNGCKVDTRRLKPSPLCIRKVENDVIIAPNGDLYKCIAGIGVGKFKLLSKDTFLSKPYLFNLYQSQWCEDDLDLACEECDYMFLCNGGCKHAAYVQGIAKECNKEFLDASLERLIICMETVLKQNGELAEWLD